MLPFIVLIAGIRFNTGLKTLIYSPSCPVKTQDIDQMDRTP